VAPIAEDPDIGLASWVGPSTDPLSSVSLSLGPTSSLQARLAPGTSACLTHAVGRRKKLDINGYAVTSLPLPFSVFRCSRCGTEYIGKGVVLAAGDLPALTWKSNAEDGLHGRLVLLSRPQGSGRCGESFSSPAPTFWFSQGPAGRLPAGVRRGGNAGPPTRIAKPGIHYRTCRDTVAASRKLVGSGRGAAGGCCLSLRGRGSSPCSRRGRLPPLRQPIVPPRG